MMNFRDARYLSRMTLADISSYLCISIQTVRKYERTGKAPKAVIECLKMIGGRCPDFRRRNDFNGWSFGSGYLWSPAGDRFTSGDVLASRINQQLCDALYKENHRLRTLNKNGDMALPANVIAFPVKKK